MGPGSHVGFPISAKNKNLVYDHPMNISAKFGSNLFCGFRKKDENVKFIGHKTQKKTQATLGTRHRKIDTGNIGHKTQKDRHGQHWAQDTER